MTPWRRWGAYLRRPPELTLVWRDRESEARGWLVINSLRGGAAGGGTRMRSGLGAAEVVYLSKAMELKFALTGPPIGGAKSGIDFDPRDARKTAVLERWYDAIEPQLRLRYGTAGDLNVDELLEVVPAVRRLGLPHPQAGIVRGHYDPDDAGFQSTLRRLECGAETKLRGEHGVAGMELGVADVITGYGVAESILRFYRRAGRDIAGARVLVEGFGNVGAACALHLARAGARIAAVSDAEKALVDDAGIDAAGVEALMRASRERLLPGDDPRVRSDDDGRRFRDVRAEIFVCAAISESIDGRRLEELEALGVDVVACGANHPFRERTPGGTAVQREADARFAVIPDVLANCGRARAFGHLMEPNARTDEAAIFDAVRATIHDALDEVLERAARSAGRSAADGAARAGGTVQPTAARGAPRGILAATLDMLLDRLGEP